MGFAELFTMRLVKAKSSKAIVGNKRRVEKVQSGKTQFLEDWISMFDLEANISVDNLSKECESKKPGLESW